MTKSTKQQSNSGPEKVFRLGQSRASVFVNEGAKGPFRTVKLERRYQDEGGDWQGSTSFGAMHLSNIIAVAQQALAFVIEQDAAEAE